MPKYRLKPLEIDAWQNYDDTGWPDWLNDVGREPGGVVLIETPVGIMRVNMGDWIIRTVNGELFPCTSDMFKANYEPADPTPPVKPTIEPGKTRVRHIDKMYAPYGLGIVKEISKSGKQAYVHWPEYDKKHFKWGPPTPSYYRLDKLEVITDAE